MRLIRSFVLVLAWLALSVAAMASPYRGVVTYGGLPLPGATVTATQGTKTVTAVSGEDGSFAFDDLADGQWTIQVSMQCFAPDESDVTIAPNMPAATFELKLLPEGQIEAQSQPATKAIEVPPVPAVAERKPEAQQPGQGNGKAQGNGTGNGSGNAAEMPKAPSEENEQSADGFLVQGSVNNAATSAYSTNPAFGNTRSGSKALYTGGFAAIIENSALDARPYSLTGREAAKPGFSDFTGVATLQGPVLIPVVHRRGPNFFVSYQWTRNSNSQILTGLVPTEAERGIASGGGSLGYFDLGSLCSSGFNASGYCTTASQQIHNPFTGQPYQNNHIPIAASLASYVPGDVSPQAQALLARYPHSNISNVTAYNYQAPVLTSAHQDALQTRLDKALGRKDQFYGGFAFQSTRAESINLFNFADQSGTLGINGNIHWTHRLKPRLFLFTSYTFSRLRTEVTPYFANRTNISGDAEIQPWSGDLNNPNDLQAPGSLQDPADWGPPALSFSTGFAGMSDGNNSFNRNRTDAASASILYYRGKHNVSVGVDYRKQEYNENFQENPRGSFTFTGLTAGPGGVASGSDLADFLVGMPDASSIAFGNADKYFREPVYDVYANDDWRVMPILTINAGLRWDYSAPITELKGRLVNLGVSKGFGSASQMEGSSLIRPDRRLISPRIGISWRPIPASTIVIRAGYGIYPDTSVYQNIVLEMAQQAPLSKSLNVQNSAACPLTLANGFTPCAAVLGDTFGIDPNFRIGYAQQWQLAVQRDLPFALQMTATYQGVKGTHGPQEILPNTYAPGEANPCPGCPLGFVYETSSGNSIRHSGQLQLRRRLRGGFAASLSYTYAKSIDDDAYLGGQGHTQGSSSQSASLSSPTASIAQNWLDPRAERSLSAFDQRQLLSVQAQYTSGQGLEGGTLLSGWRGRALKEWTVTGNVNYGTGLPETPIYSSELVPGTGFGNVIRPNLTGAPIYSSGGKTHLNQAAYVAPANGQWGTAGRDSITGPGQFSFNSSVARTFRPHGKWYLDFVVNSTNTFNHASFSSWNSSVTSSQFGLPVSPNAMRSLQTTIHLRWQ